MGYAVGLTVDEAVAQGYNVRVVEEDGVGYKVTTDYKFHRLNVVVEKGVIMSVQYIG